MSLLKMLDGTNIWHFYAMRKLVIGEDILKVLKNPLLIFLLNKM
nr:MAG TPA: hypothetical protein [Caudoviricetes sp.]